MNQNKTGWTVTLIAVLAIVCGGLVVKLWPRTVPTQQCSPIYREYAGKPGIRASFVKGYRINDTTFVDATLLKASTRAGFEQLKKDFFYLLTIDEDCNSMGKKKMHGLHTSTATTTASLSPTIRNLATTWSSIAQTPRSQSQSFM